MSRTAERIVRLEQRLAESQRVIRIVLQPFARPKPQRGADKPVEDARSDEE